MNTPDTMLKVAAEEIKEILRKYNIAAAVSLHTPGHGEHFVHLNPTYSCAYIYNENEVRFYSKREQYNSLAEQLEKQTTTSNMLIILKQITAYNFTVLMQLSDSFDELTNAEHFKLKSP
ncbi:hypothetical protein CLU81_3580 [Flavobacterium sp. 9]|uniref:hypothetical protein n=1 Tax=Flavobacterium sp. 9 TaxID=2035198 RepID=UPI000C19454E|nr:hypothetical protein [Flavobacterium sp. 9]PIF33010.1 hypothetical protein CLU81_3580 [Flavobacterium sp. 9]